MKKMTYTLLGVLIGGVLLNGNAINAAAGLMAQPSTQKIYLDGKPVQMEAYAINGNNYVKLRDVGKTVGFNVYWDGTVQIDSDAPYTGEAPASAKATAAASTGKPVTLPTDGSKYVPQVGDLIPCDDGTLYEVKDVERFENNVFAPGSLPELPTPTCDWTAFPVLELPKVEARHYANGNGDELFVRNLYETRRMVYTIYEALKDEPTAWRDGKPLAKISLTIPTEDEPYTKYFWPWRAAELQKHVHNLPNVHFRVEAWDYYHNGIFEETRYFIDIT